MRRHAKNRRRQRSSGRKSHSAPLNFGAELATYFARNGYIRWQDPERQSREGYDRYKKGSEVRLTAANRKELAHIRLLLRKAGFKPGQPFVKGRQYRLPIYGFDEVERFMALVARHGIAH